MILCSKLKNGLWKIVTKSQVVTKFDITKSRLHCNFKGSSMMWIEKKKLDKNVSDLIAVAWSIASVLLRKDRKRAEKRQEEAKGKRADRKQLFFSASSYLFWATSGRGLSYHKVLRVSMGSAWFEYREKVGKNMSNLIVVSWSSGIGRGLCGSRTRGFASHLCQNTKEDEESGKAFRPKTRICSCQKICISNIDFKSTTCTPIWYRCRW